MAERFVTSFTVLATNTLLHGRTISSEPKLIWLSQFHPLYKRLYLCSRFPIYMYIAHPLFQEAKAQELNALHGMQGSTLFYMYDYDYPADMFEVQRIMSMSRRGLGGAIRAMCTRVRCLFQPIRWGDAKCSRFNRAIGWCRKVLVRCGSISAAV
jgi:hypothetical protein